MIVRDRAYLEKDGMPSLNMLKSVISEHARTLPRLKRLMGYYLGYNDILNRARGRGLPNNRVAHPFARYIATVTSGYLAGNPVIYKYPQCRGMAQIERELKRISVSSCDAENARTAAIYGKGVEYVHAGEEGVCVTPLSPEKAFTVYSDEGYAPLFGVYITELCAPDGSIQGIALYVFTENESMCLHAADTALEGASLVFRQPHPFGGVPIIEYWNDENEKGDFEWVLGLIDAYDALESDRVNDKDQCVDRMLLLTGCTLDSDEEGRPPWLRLREDKALCLPDMDAKAEYLTAEMDETGNEILRSALKEDIHKLSMVPDLSDKSFSQNSSGVALKYKLMGLEQLTRVKEQWFKEGLRARLKLLLNFMAVKGLDVCDPADIEISFKRALPEVEFSF